MDNGLVLCNLSWRASRWIEDRTRDDEVRRSLNEKNLKRKVRVGNGFRVYFTLTRPQIRQTMDLLRSLERLRLSKSLGEVPTKTDDVIFENAIHDLKQALGEV
jgi:hypothetical protein